MFENKTQIASGPRLIMRLIIKAYSKAFGCISYFNALLSTSQLTVLCHDGTEPPFFLFRFGWGVKVSKSKTKHGVGRLFLVRTAFIQSPICADLFCWVYYSTVFTADKKNDLCEQNILYFILLFKRDIDRGNLSTHIVYLKAKIRK